MRLRDVTSFTPGRVVIFQTDNDKDPMADVLECLVLVWKDGRWCTDELFTHLYPEISRPSKIRPEHVLELINALHIECPEIEIPERPEREIGEMITFDCGSGIETGTISAIEMQVMRDRCHILYAIKEHPDMEPISEFWILNQGGAP